MQRVTVIIIINVQNRSLYAR